MAKLLLANGCSNSCAIDPENPNESSIKFDEVYPGRLQKKLGIPNYVNLAKGGASNDRIFRTTMEWISKEYLSQDKDPSELFVVIGWSQYLRKEFAWKDENEAREHTWPSYQAPYLRFWPGAFETNEDDFFVGKCRDYWKMYISYGINDFFEQRQWLSKVIGLHCFLKNHKIPHLFNNTAGFFSFQELTDYTGLIDSKNYYQMWDPDLKTAHLRTKKVLFGAEFEEKFTIGWNGHFGRDFHEHYSNILLKHIEENQLLATGANA